LQKNRFRGKNRICKPPGVPHNGGIEWIEKVRQIIRIKKIELINIGKNYVE